MRRVRGGWYSEDTDSEFTFEFRVPDEATALDIYNEAYSDMDADDCWWATNPPIDANIKWVDRGNNKGMKCSICGFPIRYKNAIPKTHGYYRYCPSCGREMGRQLEGYTELSGKIWKEPVDYNDEYIRCI